MSIRAICQLMAYQDCYNKYENYYNWFLFIDDDEYLYMNGFDNIKIWFNTYKMDDL